MANSKSSENGLELVGIENNGDEYSRKHKRKREGVEGSVAVTLDSEEAKKARKKKRKEIKDSIAEEDEAKKKKKTEKRRAQAESGPPDTTDVTDETEIKATRKKEQDPPLPPDAVTSENRQKSKHRKARAAESSADADGQVSSMVNAKDAAEVEQRKDQPGVEAALPTTHKSCKERRVFNRNAAEDLNLVNEDETPPQRKPRWKKHTATEATEPTTDHASGVDVEKTHKKKRKHKELETSHADIPEPMEPATSHRKKKRTSHKEAEYPDPSEDVALSDSARKTLAYVHAKVSGHTDWKFNKARQNWVVRNVWDDTAIPETHFKSCVKYLAGVQGNTRELLIKLSTTCLDPSALDMKSKAGTAAAASPESKPKAPTTDADGPKPEPEKDDADLASSKEQARQRRMNADRARAMLAALEIGS